MRGNRQNQIVVIRVHHIYVRPQCAPKIRKLFNRFRCRIVRRNNQTPAPVKKRRKSRFRAGMFGPGNRVGGHEMHTRWHVRANICDHLPFDRPNIGERGTLFQMRPDFSSDGTHRADRNGKNHEVGVLHSVDHRVADRIAQTDLAGRFSRLGTPGIASNMARQPAALHGPKHR